MHKWSPLPWAMASGAFALTAALYLGAAHDQLVPAHGLPVAQPLDVWTDVAGGVLAAFCAAVSLLIAVFRMRAPVPNA